MGRKADPEEAESLRRKLVQGETELLKAGEALRQLQEVIDNGSGIADDKHSQLARELSESRRELAETKAKCEGEVLQAKELRREAQSALESTASLARRCEAAEREAQDTTQALDDLLREKEQHLEEKANFVDRRLVRSMLALYSD